MKRASYRHAVAWIAVNDEAGDVPAATNPEVVGAYVSTLLVADLFDVDPERVARDIIRERQKESADA